MNPQTVEEGQSIVFTIKAYDVDRDALTFRIVDLDGFPADRVVLDSKTGEITISPESGDAVIKSTYQISIAVSDGDLDSVLRTFILEIF